MNAAAADSSLGGEICPMPWAGVPPQIVSCTRWRFDGECRKFDVCDLFWDSKFMGIGTNSSTIIQLVYRNLAENTDENQKIPKVQHT